jgi:hypothetical protein
MKNIKYYQTDFGAPPPPPPPSGMPPPPPPNGPGFTGGMQGSASTNAIIALVAGILSFLMCPFILGIVAWVMGKMEINKISRGESADAGRSMATIGMWLGIVNTALSVLAIIAYVLIILIAVISSSR